MPSAKERMRVLNACKNAAHWTLAAKYPEEYQRIYRAVREHVSEQVTGWTNKRISNLARHRAVRFVGRFHKDEWDKLVDESLIERGHNPRNPKWVEIGRRPAQ